MSSFSNDVLQFKELDESELYGNVLTDMAEDRSYPELNHGHTSGISDGNNPVEHRIKEAAKLGVPYLGFTDHASASDIIEKNPEGYYGWNLPENGAGFIEEEWFSNPETLKETIDWYTDPSQNSVSKDESFGVNLALGMELNYDPNGEEEIMGYLDEMHEILDYLLLAVHHDEEGKNFGYESAFSSDVNPREKVEEYFHLSPQAAKLGHRIANKYDLTVIGVHPDRIETNDLFRDFVTPGMYDDLFNETKSLDFIHEFNAKTNMRHMLQQGTLTIGGEVLRNHGMEFTGGTDSHRAFDKSNKVGYGVHETERRLHMNEKISEDNENMVTVLDDLELDEVRIPLSWLQRGEFWNT